MGFRSPRFALGKIKPKTGKLLIVLTFDDGFKNNVDVAAPLLSELGMKATFYIIADLLDGQSMMWNHEIRCRLELLSDESRTRFLKKSSDSTLYTITEFIDILEASSEQQREQALQKLRQLDFTTEYTLQMFLRYQIMSRRDLVNLPECIEIGSHTCTHPILDTIDDEHLLNEIKDSKKILEK